MRGNPPKYCGRAGRWLPLSCAKLLTRVCNSLIRFLVSALFVRTACKDPSDILVLRSGAIGDFICCLPALSFLRQKFPHARIHLLTTPTGNPRFWDRGYTPGALILTDSSLVDNTILFRGEDITALAQMLHLRQEITRLRPHLTYIIPQTGETWRGILKKLFFLRFLGVTSNLHGYHLERPLPFFRRIDPAGAFDHQVIAAMKAVGASKGDHIRFPIPIPDSARERIDELWEESGLETGNFVIALFPGGKFEHKRWPVENFARLCQSLAAEPTVSIVLVGGPQDKPITQRLVATCRAPLLDLSGKTSLRETAELLRRCNLYVGNDSGPAHIAAAVGIPCVTLFSSIHFPGIWEPWGAQNTAIRHPVPCEYCFSEDHCPVGTMACIRGIGVEEVLQVAELYLAKAASQQKYPSSPDESLVIRNHGT